MIIAIIKIILVVMLLPGLSSCGPASQKGAWNEADKAAWQRKCRDELGMLLAGDTNQQNEREAFCECLGREAEKQFESYAQADSDENQELFAEIIIKCMVKPDNISPELDKRLKEAVKKSAKP
jgi:hypothetical protein